MGAWMMGQLCVMCLSACVHGFYSVDPSPGMGRTFHGIGGISGGGATSKLLINYPPKERNEILDYLFKPNFGASLQILKVEIGGDAQSTDGTESSHMHESWDENYERGYEWWLMVEAKKRNPFIKIACLPWAFPGWVGEGTSDPYHKPYTTALYVVKWILGAKKYYNIDVDYVGIWNERHYNKKYVKALKETLMSHNLSNVQLVVGDDNWGVSGDIINDPSFGAVVDIIGAHYPGTVSTSQALQTNKTLWASEDYSTFNDDVGAGCWARILNQNYVKGHMTSTISWNLVASYYDALPFSRDGLMTAVEPWSGHYEVANPIWVTAHTTQFSAIGWTYLLHGSGVGELERGGSYVTLMSPDKKHFTIVIETMTYEHSICIRPKIPYYTVKSQQAEFFLKGILSDISKLNVWKSSFKYDSNHKSNVFVKMDPIQVSLSSFRLTLEPDEVYTLSTLEGGQKGQFGSSSPSKPFPLPYFDSYDGYSEYSEAFNFAPQSGVWEVRSANDKPGNKVNRQVIINKPIEWCQIRDATINIGGDYSWRNVVVGVKFLVPKTNGTKGVYVGGRVDKGGCEAQMAKGIIFAVHMEDSSYGVYCSINRKCVIKNGKLEKDFLHDKWYELKIVMKDQSSSFFIDGKLTVEATIPTSVPKNGFVGYGTTNFGIADFDDLSIS